ncbi:MAG: BsaWI family type II restriction enzyme [Leptospiraceae bacterium]|nr:BsaWI family type II restriction enzyme [Leptospiraceae bacterium]
MYNLSKEELKDLNQIQETYYMKPILEKFNTLVKNKQTTWVNAFNKIYDILVSSEKEVRKLLNKRQSRGEIEDISQAMKSIDGSAFSNCLVYLFLQNKLAGNIKPHIYITSKRARVKDFDKIATIQIGNETQKPDVDIIIYTEKENQTLDKCILLSLKTSLRERAGQTYKWKLLMEIATTENQVKEKYNIHYHVLQMPIVCFATVNFYNEINNPQHRGMFKFFDKAFIAKEIQVDFVSPLSELIPFVNEKLG